MDFINTDVLIIGTGVAGCSAALALGKAGVNVTLITRAGEPSDCSSNKAQGGIIYKNPDDSLELYEKDFKIAGDGLSNPVSVDTLYNYGPKIVEDILINECKVPFNKNSVNGQLHITTEAAHSLPRIIHKDDLTGKAIEIGLLNRLKDFPNIKIITEATAVDLLTVSHNSINKLDIYQPLTCFGAYVLLQKERRVIPIFAKETILATGGLGRIYLNTTNPEGIRGDGFALAFRAQARIINMEYIQFHPTTFFHPASERLLITESMRGEGAKLVNQSGETFMEKYHPKGSLAPRDIVARGILEEMIKTQSDCVYLDISSKDSSWIKERFPNIYNMCLNYDLDITKGKIPVVPAAHYCCGGIWTDQNCQTTLKRLCAVGETACNGLHGANRLASSSLLECLVFGTLTGKNIIDKIEKEKYFFPEIQQWKQSTEIVDHDLIRQDWLIIKHTMWNYVGIIRTSKRLDRSFKVLTELKNEIYDFYSKAELSDEIISLRNAVQTALLVVYSAYYNRKSAGCHYRKDD